MTIRSALLAATAAALLASPALAAERPVGWYVAGAGGANWVDDIDTGPTTGFDFDTGWAVEGSVGHRWDYFRLEAEVAYRQNDFDLSALTVGAAPVLVVGSGDISALSGMINGVLTAPLGDKFDAYLGAGAGVAQVDLERGAFGPFLAFEDDDVVFAWQGLAGLSYWLNPRLELFAEYRYFNAQEPDFLTDDYEAHTAFLGLRYNIGEAEEPAPEPTPTPPEPVEVKEFVVYFDFDKANLTAEAQAVVAEAAAAIQAGQNVSVTVVGHTDTVGSAAYNQRLSERRANAVKKELVRLGVGEGAISTSGVGFSQPAVDTGPGVREPRNRRATINF